MATKTNFNNNQPHIAKTDFEGNILWAKSYSPNPEWDMHWRDMEKCPDGGYVMCGFRYFPGPQASWVVKVDSLGNTCSITGCDSTVIVSSTDLLFLEKNTAVSVHPNPLRSKGVLSYTIPPKYAAHACWRLYNAQGIEVRSLRLSPHESQWEFTLRHCLPGMYYWHLEVGGEQIKSGKLVVE